MARLPLPSAVRQPARHALAAAAVLCTLFVGCSVLATLAAGTMQMDGGYPDGAGYLLFSPLAPVHFYGILPSPEAPPLLSAMMKSSTHDDDKSHGDVSSETRKRSTADLDPYDVKISLFLNALGYEWPRSPTWGRSTGIIRNTNGGVIPDLPSAEFPTDLASIARRMGLDKDSYACLLAADSSSSQRLQPCSNTFLHAWWLYGNIYLTSASTPELLPTGSPRITTYDMFYPVLLHLAALAVLAFVAIKQWYLRAHYRPGNFFPGTSVVMYDCPRVLGDLCPCDRMCPSEHEGRAIRAAARRSGLVKVAGVYAVAVGAAALQGWRV
ncbi:hypothetical protein Micbo1qcDRAFT_167665, partial [Microdochium bolleyi]